MKTVLNPNAPWPYKNSTKKAIGSKIDFSDVGLDYFADAYEGLSKPIKRGKGNPNAGKNFKKVSLQS